jgi:hypothetical protein
MRPKTHQARSSGGARPTARSTAHCTVQCPTLHPQATGEPRCAAAGGGAGDVRDRARTVARSPPQCPEPGVLPPAAIVPLWSWRVSRDDGPCPAVNLGGSLEIRGRTEGDCPTSVSPLIPLCLGPVAARYP